MKSSAQSEDLRASRVAHATIVGGGVIGASWARAVPRQWRRRDDQRPRSRHSRQGGKAIIEGALPALAGLGYRIDGLMDRLDFQSDLVAAMALTDLVQECGPEKVDFKKALWRRVEAAAPKDALLLSSSSSIPASAQYGEMTEPGRLIIGHPFNPPHLMPLVELVPTDRTPPELVARALAFYRGIGKVALGTEEGDSRFRREPAASRDFSANACIWCARLSSRCAILDDIVTSSLGIRWATNGPFLSFHLGGGAGGMAHFVEHLGKGGMGAVEDLRRGLL